METVRYDQSLLTDHDTYLFKEGSHFRLFEKLGSHAAAVDGVKGIQFAVWAPNAKAVFVIGDFNGWNPHTHPLRPRWDASGIWEGFVTGVEAPTVYKYRIVSNHNDYEVQKGDPYAFRWEQPPRTGSVVCNLDYQWNDGDWMQGRSRHNALDSPMAILEVHPGSWRRMIQEGHRFLNYRELAHRLAEYVTEMGFTHVELMPVMEHPFYGSWGYQITGFFAPTSRYGIPQDFMYLVDHLHQNGIGVILDWVPSHFPSDQHGLVYFDGTHLYEHADSREGFHPEWKSHIFNYGRHEVQSFLISNALFWLDRYHVDGLRVDAVASMLYRDYARSDGDWIPNRYGGRENLEAIGFLQRLNHVVYERFPDVQVIAEESTAWPMVTRPTHVGGLGFGLKWNMGWMHDTLDYFSKDSVFRKYHHDQLTFSLWYAFTENFMLPLSHDEVVHGKGSLLRKMPGDDWQKFANLRLLLGYMYAHPGKKLLFMGGEFGQWDEWYHDQSLDWNLLEHRPHQGMRDWVRDLNRFYRGEPALQERDFDAGGFAWVDVHDWEQSVISFVRKGREPGDTVLTVCNLTPVPRGSYRIGAPAGGYWAEVLNSDAAVYGGSGQGNLGGLETDSFASHGFPQSLSLTLPPLGILFLKRSA
jgi:1,4-alpha-glucan branching enzyme